MSDRRCERRSVYAWIALAGACVGLASVAVHLPPLRRTLEVQGRCPAIDRKGGDAPRGPALEVARRAALAPLAGDATAPPLSIAGLPIDGATRAAVRAWAEKRGISCADVDGVAIRCGAASAFLGTPADGFFRFDGERLVGIDAVGSLASTDLGPFEAARAALAQTLGAPHEEHPAKDWATSKVARVSSVWRFRDLAVDVSAFVVGDARRVRLQVRSLR